MIHTTFCMILTVLPIALLYSNCSGQDNLLKSNESKQLLPGFKHLRNGDKREWDSFPKNADAKKLKVEFELTESEQKAASAFEHCLKIRQQDVKQLWKVSLNGMSLGRLVPNENDMTIFFAVEKEALKPKNVLEIETSSKSVDDIRVGQIELIAKPKKEFLSESELSVVVVDSETQRPIPSRLTILSSNSLHEVGNQSTKTLAVRPGVVYTSSGKARIKLPA